MDLLGSALCIYSRLGIVQQLTPCQFVAQPLFLLRTTLSLYVLTTISMGYIQNCLSQHFNYLFMVILGPPDPTQPKHAVHPQMNPKCPGQSYSVRTKMQEINLWVFTLKRRSTKYFHGCCKKCKVCFHLAAQSWANED